MPIRFIIDRRQKRQIVQERVALQEYQYEEPVPEINWILIPGDSIIAGYDCKKAACNLYGREYVAWYAPDVQLPYGPYQFNGLPGLIFKITTRKIISISQSPDCSKSISTTRFM